MDAALRNIEDKLKRLSTEQALILFLFAAASVLGLCVAMTTTLLKRLKFRKAPPAPAPEPARGWAAVVKRVLVSSVRWSGPRKWPGEAASVGSWGENSPLPLLEKRRMMSRNLSFDHDDDDDGGDEYGVGVGWKSLNPHSPVWQRPILMGEKCELPRFSGVILYDENGRLLCDNARKQHSCNLALTQEKRGAVVRTTLRDLL
ncbi:uncharacterized protein LOC133798774 isoform X2 [Humulus lupulus]|uniref:uncharacterized protein LOC133798774 isoform X2 n=1 Tax=Humulus lupulus TaxID=3486 RepID=UPI002B41065C|nr:uncharacterized protein LOC133798774 isoform X2 [Humulus lupulus]